jgi:capsular polysaccharide biosynthesis protein
MSTKLGRDELLVHRISEMKKEIFYLLIIPLFMVASIAVASLFLSVQRPIYRAQAILYCSVSPEGVDRHTARSNICHAAANTAIVVQACTLMGKSPSSVTSHIIRTSSRLGMRSGLIYLVTEAHDPQLASDYVNSLAKAICTKHNNRATGQARLEERALPHDYPDSPQWTISLLLAAAGGFVAGLAFYLFGYALRRQTAHEKNLYGEKSAQPGP